MTRTITLILTFLSCVCFSFNPVLAQDTIQVGTTLNFNFGNQYPAPYGNNNSGVVHQVLYLASELQALGMAPGDITALEFNVAFANGTSLTDFEIKMKHTTSSSLTNFETGLSTVYGPLNFADNAGWNNHTLTTPFSWDGTSNILIQTCFWNGSNTSNALMYYTSTSFTSVLYRGSNFASPCPNLFFPSQSTARPTLRFIYTPDTLPPSVAFVANDTFTCSGTVNFINNTPIHFPTTWLWDFGDGNTDTSRNPSHIYTTDSTYDVQLIATNQYGADTLLILNYVRVKTSAGLTAASCTPPTKNYCCGFGITNVTLGTINNNSSDGADGYMDYSCQIQTSIIEGWTYGISIDADTPSNHNVVVWIDFNDDGIFDPNTEEVFESLNKKTHVGTMTIPSGTVQNKFLRMRVAADYAVHTIPTPCDTIENGQIEDYGVMILPNTIPPSTAFEVGDTLSCNGVVSFTDLSAFAPSSWHWDFGDGDTDTVQNPIHTYTVDGYYDVELIATNQFGSDTVLKSNYVHITLGATPTAANCTPNTQAFCCGYGISNVAFENINFSSGDASEGYLNMTCGQKTNLVEGGTHLLSITTAGANPQDTRAYIDYNNDGSFTSNELILSEDNAINASGNISIPGGIVLNTPLRFRVLSDYAGSLPNSCTNPLYGQAEDFTVTILPNTLPPDVAFAVDDTSTCNGVVQFSDSSNYAPTSWFWDFGDGNTDTVQHPMHTYAATGYFNVKLKVCNGFGCDSTTKMNYVNVLSLVGGPVAASCTPTTTNYCCGVGIYNVSLGSINKSTANGGSDSYQDYSCGSVTQLNEGMNYNMSVTTGPNFGEHCIAWIDFNNDGAFDPNTEEVFRSMNTLTNHSDVISIPTGAVLDTTLRMRVVSDRAGGGPPPNSCSDPRFGQVEDYGVIIIASQVPPVAQVGSVKSTVCNGLVNFMDSSSFVPTSWHWDFGDGDTSVLQNPTHTYASTGLYTITLIATNQHGSDTIVEVNYINVTSIDGPKPATCEPTTASFQFNMGIRNFTLDSISYSSGSVNQDGGNLDLTCSRVTTLKEGKTYNLSTETNGNFPESVVAWIDYNNDGAFDINTEEIFFSDSVLQFHSGSFKVSSGGVYGKQLRLRVASDFGGVAKPAPCGTLVYGQSEDYTVIIKANIAPPLGDFTADNVFTCDGTVQFNDATLNGPTSWFWSFGDGDTSHSQHPNHTYTQQGTYSVILVVSNAYGQDTITKLSYITYSGGPQTTNCISNTTQLSGFFRTGIFNMNFEQINNSSGSSIADSGYVDFSCSQQTYVTEGQTYPVKVTTGNQVPENVRIWIDLNNDADFNPVTELVFSSDSIMTNHSGNISIPFGSVTATPLRMRVSTDVPQMPDPLPCIDVNFGQAEDYTVIILSNESPPISSFEGKKIDPCQGTCTFRDKSVGNPTSWSWDFGDGGTSTLQHPFYTYTNPGTYTVTMIAINQYGVDTIQHLLDVYFVSAKFDQSNDSVGVGHNVFFTNRTKGENLKYFWDFDDGDDSTGQHPDHIYTVPGNYIVTLVATDSLRNCNSAWTAPMTVLEFMPGIGDDSKLLLAVYPNPANDHFIIQSNELIRTEVQVSLYDMSGRKISIQSSGFGSNKWQVNTQNIASGIYIIEVQTENDRWLNKIVIER